MNTNSKSDLNSNPHKKLVKLKRCGLPIKVSDKTWEIFENIQRIQPLKIKTDPTYQNGTVSRNVKAQFVCKPSKFEIYIVIYDEDVTEETLVHEALHAKMMVKGYPFFYARYFPEKKTIANLSNDIQHLRIFRIMEEMGFTPKLQARKGWKRGIEIFNSNTDKIPLDAPDYVVNTIGATTTLSILVLGIGAEEIREALHPRYRKTVDIGIGIYEELKNYDLSNKKECFNALIKVASALQLNNNDTVIGILDFQNRERRYYSVKTGDLLVIK